MDDGPSEKCGTAEEYPCEAAMERRLMPANQMRLAMHPVNHVSQKKEFDDEAKTLRLLSLGGRQFDRCFGVRAVNAAERDDGARRIRKEFAATIAEQFT